MPINWLWEKRLQGEKKKRLQEESKDPIFRLESLCLTNSLLFSLSPSLLFVSFPCYTITEALYQIQVHSCSCINLEGTTPETFPEFPTVGHRHTHMMSSPSQHQFLYNCTIFKVFQHKHSQDELWSQNVAIFFGLNSAK